MTTTSSSAVVAAPKAKPQEKNQTRRVPPFNVILENDDHHSCEFVIEVLRKALGIAEERAIQLMLQAHTSGRAIVWTAPKEVAELKADQIRSFHEIRASIAPSSARSSAHRAGTRGLKFPRQSLVMRPWSRVPRNHDLTTGDLMRRTLFSIGLALSACLLASIPSRGEDAAKEPFFNGKNLDGWEGLTKYWTYKDGALIGTGGEDKIPFNTFLCSKKTYKDFELKFKIKLKGGAGNSGVQIRSKIFDKEKFAVAGPQCDIGEDYWGSLYGEGPGFGGMIKARSDEAKAKVKKDEFNDYYIKAVGKHCTIKLNGVTSVNGDFDKMPDEGIIAWQLHGGWVMEVTFKDIEFKDLTAK